MLVWMSKSSMPNGRGSPSSREGGLVDGVKLRKADSVEAVFTGSSEEGSVGNLVLHRKIRGVKFKKDIIIKAKFLYRKKILFDVRDMENVGNVKGFKWGKYFG